ncbi:MAG: hypothetical protein EP299_02915 [Acidobacteria bacterium]|nr:MAG: hypothetical protein EP299_02915 [Acidobacteriota bacterium]
MILWLIAVGVLTLLGQVVLLRELNVALFGSELIYILGLGVWLLGTAAGAAAGRRGYHPTAQRVRLLFVVLSLLVPLSVVLARDLRILLVGVPGAYPPFSRQLLGMAMVLLPVSVVGGLLFQWVAKRYVRHGRTLAAAYAIESAGALVGGILATVFLRWGLQNFTAALICSWLALLAAGTPWRRERPIWLPPVLGLVGTALLVATLTSGTIDRHMTGWNHPGLLVTRDTPYSRVTVTEAAEQLTVFENDALAFESQGTAAEEFAHLAALQHPKPVSVLVLGGGFAQLVEELLRHRPRRIDYVELNEQLLELVSSHLPTDTRRSLVDPSVRVLIEDPRRYLDTSGHYDLILIGMPEPESGQANRFYTRDFFARCAARLEPKGVLALRLRGAENLWTPQLIRRTASIHRALLAVFPNVVVLPGTTNIILASVEPLPGDPDVLAERLEARGIDAQLVIPPYIRYLYTNDRFFEIGESLVSADAPINTDIRPVCYQYTLLIWLSKFYLPMAWLDLPTLNARELMQSPLFWVLAATATALFLLARRGPLVRRSMLAAVAGFVGMVLETVLILHYQTGSGVLYQDLGLLLTMFMAGLALGALVADRWAATAKVKLPFNRATGMLFLWCLGVVSALLGWLLQEGMARGLGATSLLLLACGFLVAAVFAYASLYGRPDQQRAVSPLYAADLLGGCLGALLASLVLIPTFGLASSALLMALAALLALLLA